MPPALGKHFDRADPTLQTLLSPNLAESYACVPLVRVGKRVVVASMAPLPHRVRPRSWPTSSRSIPNGSCAVIGRPRAAAFRYFLERVYKIPRMQRFLRVRGAFARQRSPPCSHRRDRPRRSTPAALAPAPHRRSSRRCFRRYPSRYRIRRRRPCRGRRRWARTPALHPDLGRCPRDASGQGLDRHPGPRPARRGRRRRHREAEPPTRPSTDAELAADRVAAIERGRDRDAVAQLVMDAVAAARSRRSPRRCCSSSAVTVAATTWTNFARDGSTLQPIAVPLDHAGLVALVP